MSNVWKKLKKDLNSKPIMVLAPMANVTDSPFRRIVAKCGKPDIFFNEFISCDGLFSSGRDKLLKFLRFTSVERPLIVQFFGSRPDNFYKCAQLAQEFGFDGIDINMGCPDRSVEKQGGGAALIKNPKLAQEIIKETKRGAGSLSVSVKTRLGYNKIEIKEWIPRILEMDIEALSVHGRTRKEMSSVPAHWDYLGEIAEMVHGSNALIIGNGDVVDLADAYSKADTYGLDGIMIGRGIFKNLWFFNKKQKIISPKEKIKILKKHLELFSQFWGEDQNFDVMKKFFKVYINGWPGANDLRARLMNTKIKKDAESIIDSIF
ncbi:MAG TPA: tRNA-dihydrouridine synthase [Candidatus Paceibacterota bacterium]